MNFINRQFESMSSRDRKLLAGMMIFFSSIFVLALLFTLNSWLDDRAATIAQQKDKYEMLLVLREQYAAAHDEVLVAQKTAEQYKGKTPSSFLEETASKVGIRDALTVSKQGAQDEAGSVKSTGYKIVLKRISLEESVNFLYDVETSGYPVSVDSAVFKTSKVRGEKVLTVTLDAMHYEIGEAG